MTNRRHDDTGEETRRRLYETDFTDAGQDPFNPYGSGPVPVVPRERKDHPR